jgi:hypothetical protein
MGSLRSLITDFRYKQLAQRHLNDKRNRMYFLDYQRQLILNSRGERLLLRGKKRPIDLLREGVYRCCMLVRFHMKKENFLSDLIEELKRQALEEEEKDFAEVKFAIKSAGKLILSKLEMLIVRRVAETNKDQQLVVKQINALQSLL